MDCRNNYWAWHLTLISSFQEFPRREFWFTKLRISLFGFVPFSYSLMYPSRMSSLSIDGTCGVATTWILHQRMRANVPLDTRHRNSPHSSLSFLFRPRESGENMGGTEVSEVRGQCLSTGEGLSRPFAVLPPES